MKFTYTLLVFLFGIFVSGCSIEQYHRDSLRYSTTDRGTETYKITNKDSLTAAIERNKQEIELYRQHHQISYEIEDSRSLSQVITDINKIKTKYDVEIKEVDRLSQTESKSKKPNKDLLKKYADTIDKHKLFSNAHANTVPNLNTLANSEVNPELLKPAKQLAISLEDQGKLELLTIDEMINNPVENNYKVKTTFALAQLPNNGSSQISLTWPEKLINDSKLTTKTTETESKSGDKTKVTETVGPDPDLLRALSSTASISQMRDLLTEPAFPSLLPTERTTKLGCLAPPDSAAFEATMKLKASIEKKDINGQATVDANYASSVVKLFEESERTLFLQYALFRLCEMSINAPSGFRNVYPVVVHDIVRRTAEMNELANKEAEGRRIKEEETNQKKIELKIKELEGLTNADAAKFAKEAKNLDLIASKNNTYQKCILNKIELKSADKPEDIKKTCKDLADIQ